jgi:hypothetical protein
MAFSEDWRLFCLFTRYVDTIQARNSRHTLGLQGRRKSKGTGEVQYQTPQLFSYKFGMFTMGVFAGKANKRRKLEIKYEY